MTFSRRFGRIVLLCSALLVLFGVDFIFLNGENPEWSETKVPWKAGERLVFEIKWGILPAGRGILEVKQGEQEKKNFYQFEATSVSNAFLDVFYKVRDHSISWYDPVQKVSHRFEQKIREGKYHMDQVMEFDWKNLRFKNSELVKGQEPKLQEGELSLPAVDILSSLYLSRTHSLQEGKEYIFNVHSGKYWPLVLKVHKKEVIKVPAGTFECYLVQPFLRERGLFVEKGKKLRIWMTADERKMPVLMKAEIFIGHVSAELREYR